MEIYKNFANNSGVRAFEIGENYIKVKFIDGIIYLYTYQSAGKVEVEQMKKLARAGKGLSGFISAHVRNSYASKSNR